MSSHLLRRLRKGIGNVPNLLRGFNIYVSREKIALIQEAFDCVRPVPESFADLGGVWRVNAAYTIFALERFRIEKAVLVDTDFNEVTDRKLKRYGNLSRIQGNFGDPSIIERVGEVEAVFLFDVLLHQVDPDWDEVLTRYSALTRCFVVYNQQYIGSGKTVRLTSLPLEEYRELVPRRKDDLYDFIFSHKDEMNPEHNRPWIDIHNIWQWGIIDSDLRKVLERLGYREVFFRNYGPAFGLRHFENHGFIFVRE